jgi:hypothetical protein
MPTNARSVVRCSVASLAGHSADETLFAPAWDETGTAAIIQLCNEAQMIRLLRRQKIGTEETIRWRFSLEYRHPSSSGPSLPRACGLPKRPAH